MTVEQTPSSYARAIAHSKSSTATLIPRKPVDQVHYSALSSQEFRRRYRNPGIPLVVQGLLDQEPAWDLSYLRQILGNQIFPVRRYGHDWHQQDKREWKHSGSGVRAESMEFSSYADQIERGSARYHNLYLARCSFKNTPLERMTRLEKAESYFQLKFPATQLNLWVGPSGHISSLHYDPMDGILMQLYGRKKILLFPPSQTYNLYPIPVYKQLLYGLKLRPVYSQVYPEKPDFQAFPKFRNALPHAVEVVLKPGEMLFLPAGWWHEVTSLGEGMVCSVNRFWNVFPIARALATWPKWRAHFGSVLATPHLTWNLIKAISHKEADLELRKIIQRL